MSYLRRLLGLFAKRCRLLLLKWELRNIDPDLCCCGCDMGKGGDICHHGGCRSAKEYYISSAMGKP